MSKLLLPTLIISLALWLLLGSFWLGKQETENSQEVELSENPVFVIEHDTFKVSANTIFAFEPSQAEVIINDEQIETLGALALYLDRTPKKQILLKAFYKAEERWTKSFNGNLGLARANTIRNILVRQGAPEEQVKIDGSLTEDLAYNENGLISGGVVFDIFDREPSSLAEKKVTFFFEKDKFEITKTTEIEESVALFKQLLVDFPASKLRIYPAYSGKGMPPEEAKKRGEIVKSFYLEKGIDPDRFGPVLFENLVVDSFKDDQESKKSLKAVKVVVL